MGRTGDRNTGGQPRDTGRWEFKLSVQEVIRQITQPDVCWKVSATRGSVQNTLQLLAHVSIQETPRTKQPSHLQHLRIDAGLDPRSTNWRVTKTHTCQRAEAGSPPSALRWVSSGSLLEVCCAKLEYKIKEKRIKGGISDQWSTQRKDTLMSKHPYCHSVDTVSPY